MEVSRGYEIDPIPLSHRIDTQSAKHSRECQRPRAGRRFRPCSGHSKLGLHMERHGRVRPRCTVDRTRDLEWVGYV